MKLFETGEHRRGKLHAQGPKPTITDQSVEITDDEAGYFVQLQESQAYVPSDIDISYQ